MGRAVWSVVLMMAAGVGRSVSAEASAGPRGASSGVVTFYFENDGTIVKPNHRRDRHYTSGIKITFAGQPDWAAAVVKRMPFSPAGDGQELHTAAGWAIGQSIFTPEDIDIPTPIPDDQPYAGWLYGGVYLQRATQNVFDHFEINLGVIGPSSLAEDVQREVHDLFDQVSPRGWDNQLGDEFGFDAIFQRKWKITLLTSGGADAVQLIPQAGFTLGTVHRQANLGAVLRIGVHMPDDFGPGRIEEPAAATGRSPTRPGGYFFVRVSGTAVEHNTILEGNNNRSSQGVEPEALFGQVQVGFVVLWGQFELGYSQTFQSRQFKGQSDKDSFGGLTLSWRGEF